MGTLNFPPANVQIQFFQMTQAEKSEFSIQHWTQKSQHHTHMGFGWFSLPQTSLKSAFLSETKGSVVELSRWDGIVTKN